MVMDIQPPNEKRVLALIENPQSNGENDLFKLYISAGDQRFQTTISLQDMIEDLRHPIGSTFFLIEQYFQVADPESWKMSKFLLAPKFDLNLKENHLDAGLGFSTDEKKLTASWLSSTDLTDTAGINVQPESVHIEFPGGYQVVVQRDTGLLSVAHWPDQPDTHPQKITLLNHEKLEDSQRIQEWVPDFDTLDFQHMPPNQLLPGWEPDIYLDFSQMLLDQNDFEQKLDQKGDIISENVLTEARRRIHDTARQFVANNPTQNVTSEALWEKYQGFLEANPDLKNDATFSDYLDALFQYVEKHPGNSMIGVLDKAVDDIQQAYMKGIQVLPEENKVPLNLLFEKTMPALMEAWRLEFLSATHDRARIFRKSRTE